MFFVGQLFLIRIETSLCFCLGLVEVSSTHAYIFLLLEWFLFPNNLLDRFSWRDFVADSIAELSAKVRLLKVYQSAVRSECVSFLSRIVLLEELFPTGVDAFISVFVLYFASYDLFCRISFQFIVIGLFGFPGALFLDLIQDWLNIRVRLVFLVRSIDFCIPIYNRWGLNLRRSFLWILRISTTFKFGTFWLRCSGKDWSCILKVLIRNGRFSAHSLFHGIARAKPSFSWLNHSDCRFELIDNMLGASPGWTSGALWDYAALSSCTHEFLNLDIVRHLDLMLGIFCNVSISGWTRRLLIIVPHMHSWHSFRPFNLAKVVFQRHDLRIIQSE